MFAVKEDSVRSSDILPRHDSLQKSRKLQITEKWINKNLTRQCHMLDNVHVVKYFEIMAEQNFYFTFGK